MIFYIEERYPWGDLTNYVYKIFAGLSERHKKHFWYGVLLALEFDSELLNDWPGSKKVHQVVSQDLYRQTEIHPGEMLHFIMRRDNRNEYRFCPPVYTLFVQDFEVVWTKRTVYVFLDGMRLVGPVLDLFLKEEGFDSLEDFKRYYPKDFYGFCIHWEYEGF